MVKPGMTRNLTARVDGNKVFRIARLALNDFFLRLRSRAGFSAFMHLLRWMAFIAILYRFVWANTFVGWPAVLAGTYFGFLLINLIVIRTQRQLLEKPYWHPITILLEASLFIAFIYLTANPKSDLYLLLLLPLLATAHFLDRGVNIIFAVLILAGYLVAIRVLGSDTGDLLQVSGRAAFLFVSAFLFRIQRGLPHPQQDEVIEPRRARDHLEEKLQELKKVIPHDTVSLQILYRGRFQVVACLWLEGVHRDDVCRLEFPAGDPRFPNHLVVASRRIEIVDAEDYPSFQVPGYMAGHIKTWMGVPLLHPATGELFGLLSVDSAQKDAYTEADGRRVQQFANYVATYLTEVALGPAALSLMAKRENIDDLLWSWAKILPTSTRRWEDSLQAARELVKEGQRIFHVEDCSISFIHSLLDPAGVETRVLRLVASSNIPQTVFGQHESPVTGEPGDGFTGRAVFLNRTLNYGAEEYEPSPYWAGYTAHLPYLFSRESRQVLISPLRNSRGEAVGTIKLENKMGQATNGKFPPLEVHLFEIFSAMVSLILENIRQRNFVDRQRQDIHGLRSIVLTLAKSWAEDYVGRVPADNRRADDQHVQNMRNVTEYCETILHGLLIEGGRELAATSEDTAAPINGFVNAVLESEGVAPAVFAFVNALIRTDLPWYAPACRRVKVTGMEIRDRMPYAVRVIFYNIAREGVRNIARHSGIEKKPDGEACVRFVEDADAFEMCIEDNGRGAALQEQTNPLTNFGLQDIQRQFDALTNMGCLDRKEVFSEPGKGFRILVRWKPEIA